MSSSSASVPYIHDVFIVTDGYKSVLSIDLNSDPNQEHLVVLTTALSITARLETH